MCSLATISQAEKRLATGSMPMAQTETEYLTDFLYGNATLHEGHFNKDINYSAIAGPIRLKDLPKAAMQYIKENYPVTRVKYVTKTRNNNGETIYEVGVKMENKLYVVQFDSKGEYIDNDV